MAIRMVPLCQTLEPRKWKGRKKGLQMVCLRVEHWVEVKDCHLDTRWECPMVRKKVKVQMKA